MRTPIALALLAAVAFTATGCGASPAQLSAAPATEQATTTAKPVVVIGTSGTPNADPNLREVFALALTPLNPSHDKETADLLERLGAGICAAYDQGKNGGQVLTALANQIGRWKPKQLIQLSAFAVAAFCPQHQQVNTEGYGSLPPGLLSS